MQGQVESVDEGHDPKDALVGMILAHYDSEQAVLASLHSELKAMPPREIEARAAGMGITAESLDKAKDQNDVKEALIRIVIGHTLRVRHNYSQQHAWPMAFSHSNPLEDEWSPPPTATPGGQLGNHHVNVPQVTARTQLWNGQPGMGNRDSQEWATRGAMYRNVERVEYSKSTPGSMVDERGHSARGTRVSDCPVDVLDCPLLSLTPQCVDAHLDRRGQSAAGARDYHRIYGGMAPAGSGRPCFDGHTWSSYFKRSVAG